MKKIKVNADLYVGDNKLATVKDIDDKLDNTGDGTKFLSDDGTYKEVIANGADGTGFMCTALEGLLGVNENDLAKDYELTSFSKYGVRKRSDASGNYHYRTRLERIKGETGDTLADKWLAHFAAQGLTEDDVKALRNLMLE